MSSHKPAAKSLSALAALVVIAVPLLVRAEEVKRPNGTTSPQVQGPVLSFEAYRPDETAGNATANKQLIDPSNDFWIVSTRKCPQRVQGRFVGCSPEYHYLREQEKLKRADRNAFDSWLDPSKPLAVVVHGSFIEASEVVSLSKAHFKWLKSATPTEEMQVVYFTWPSLVPSVILPPFSIEILGRRAAFNGIYLAQFLASLPSELRVGLAGHSHGARMVCAALHLLAGGRVQGYQLVKHSNGCSSVRVVFTAAAVDHHWLNRGGRYGLALQRAESVLNITNRADWALSLYPLHAPFIEPALGQNGLTWIDRQQLGVQNSRVREMDVSRVVGNGHNISDYFKSTEISKAINQQLFGPPTLAQ